MERHPPDRPMIYDLGHSVEHYEREAITRDMQDAAEEKFFCSTCHHPVGEHVLLSEEDWDYAEKVFHCAVTDCGCVRDER